MYKYFLIISMFLFSFTLQEQPYEVSITSTSVSVLFYQEGEADVRFSLLFRGLDARTMMNMYLETGKPIRSSDAFIIVTKEYHDGKISFVVSPEEYKMYRALGLVALKVTWKD